MIAKHKNKMGFRKAVSGFILLSFLTGQIWTPSMARAQLLANLPAPGQAVWLTPVFQPPVLRGMTIHAENPLLFDFIVDRGQDKINNDLLKDESTKLIKYFLASMTIPDKDAWVNLSPYEKDRIIPDALGQTEMGRQMLEQDYILKQLSASLTNPDKELGQKFWNEVKARAQKQFGTTDIPLNTFNKVWIVPDGATVVEKDGFAYITESKLKVMLDEDYVAMTQASVGNGRDRSLQNLSSPQSLSGDPQVKNGPPIKAFGGDRGGVQALSTQVFREMILPKLVEEVNTGKNFAQTRQVYQSVILAAWYKKALKDSLLGRIYADKSKVEGVESDVKDIKQKVYDQYLEAFKKGVYNVIKEDASANSDDPIPRKYFSGGLGFDVFMKEGPTIDISEKGRQVAASSVEENRNNFEIVQAVGTETIAEASAASTVNSLRAAPADTITIDIPKESIAIKRFAPTRSLAEHSILGTPWEGKRVFETPLTVYDHLVAAVTGAAFGTVPMVAFSTYFFYKLSDNSAVGGFSGLLTLASTTQLFVIPHYREFRDAFLVYKDAKLYNDKPESASIDKRLQRIAKKFENETGWSVKWTDDPYILALPDLNSKSILLSVGFLIKNPDRENDRRLAYLTHVLRLIRKGIESVNEANVKTNLNSATGFEKIKTAASSSLIEVKAKISELNHRADYPIGFPTELMTLVYELNDISPSLRVSYRSPEIYKEVERIMSIGEYLNLAAESFVAINNIEILTNKGYTFADIPQNIRAKFDDNEWILKQLDTEDPNVAVERVVEFQSGYRAQVSGNADMLLAIAADPNIRRIEMSTPTGWMKNIYRVPAAQRTAGYDWRKAYVDQIHVQSLEDSGLVGQTVAHGTIKGFEESVKAGAQNIGQNQYGGLGLSLYMSADQENATRAAITANHVVPQKIEMAPENFTSGNDPIVMVGRIRKIDKPLKVAKFEVSRNVYTPDFVNGRLPLGWDKDPNLQAIMLELDVLDIHARETPFDDPIRTVVVHESASDVIEWNPKSEDVFSTLNSIDNKLSSLHESAQQIVDAVVSQGADADGQFKNFVKELAAANTRTEEYAIINRMKENESFGPAIRKLIDQLEASLALIVKAIKLPATEVSATPDYVPMFKIMVGAAYNQVNSKAQKGINSAALQLIINGARQEYDVRYIIALDDLRTIVFDNQKISSETSKKILQELGLMNADATIPPQVRKLMVFLADQQSSTQIAKEGDPVVQAKMKRINDAIGDVLIEKLKVRTEDPIFFLTAKVAIQTIFQYALINFYSLADDAVNSGWAARAVLPDGSFGAKPLNIKLGRDLLSLYNLQEQNVVLFNAMGMIRDDSEQSGPRIVFTRAFFDVIDEKLNELKASSGVTDQQVYDRWDSIQNEYILYHGTSINSAAQIRQFGLSDDEKPFDMADIKEYERLHLKALGREVPLKSDKGVIHLTTKPQTAILYAQKGSEVIHMMLERIPLILESRKLTQAESDELDRISAKYADYLKQHKEYLKTHPPYVLKIKGSVLTKGNVSAFKTKENFLQLFRSAEDKARKGGMTLDLEQYVELLLLGMTDVEVENVSPDEILFPGETKNAEGASASSALTDEQIAAATEGFIEDVRAKYSPQQLNFAQETTISFIYGAILRLFNNEFPRDQWARNADSIIKDPALLTDLSFTGYDFFGDLTQRAIAVAQPLSPSAAFEGEQPMEILLEFFNPDARSPLTRIMWTSLNQNIKSLAASSGVVLVVDDDLKIRQQFAEALNRSGYMVLQASNVADAISIVESVGGRINLITTDGQMPLSAAAGLEGDEAGRAGLILTERLQERFPSIPVLLISGDYYLRQDAERRKPQLTNLKGIWDKGEVEVNLDILKTQADKAMAELQQGSLGFDQSSVVRLRQGQSVVLVSKASALFKHIVSVWGRQHDPAEMAALREYAGFFSEFDYSSSNFRKGFSNYNGWMESRVEQFYAAAKIFKKDFLGYTIYDADVAAILHASFKRNDKGEIVLVDPLAETDGGQGENFQASRLLFASSGVNNSVAAASAPAIANPGGIDFDPSKLNLQIKRDGHGVPLPLPQQDLENININGLYPVIINIMPINAQTLPILSQLNPQPDVALSKG